MTNLKVIGGGNKSEGGIFWADIDCHMFLERHLKGHFQEFREWVLLREPEYEVKPGPRGQICPLVLFLGEKIGEELYLGYPRPGMPPWAVLFFDLFDEVTDKKLRALHRQGLEFRYLWEDAIDALDATICRLENLGIPLE
jgi:hypothetical protein